MRLASPSSSKQQDRNQSVQKWRQPQSLLAPHRWKLMWRPPQLPFPRRPLSSRSCRHAMTRQPLTWTVASRPLRSAASRSRTHPRTPTSIYPNSLDTIAPRRPKPVPRSIRRPTSSKLPLLAPPLDRYTTHTPTTPYLSALTPQSPGQPTTSRVMLRRIRPSRRRWQGGCGGGGGFARCYGRLGCACESSNYNEPRSCGHARSIFARAPAD